MALDPSEVQQTLRKGFAEGVELEEEAEFPVMYLPVDRGDVTIHDEWVVHGSGGNSTDSARATYVIAFRDARMVEYERSVGFSHSYTNDPAVLRNIRDGAL